MSLSDIRGYLFKPKSLLVAGLVLAGFFVFLLIPRQPDSEKLQSLLERGNYQAAREGAQQILAREPQDHLVREVLVKSYLGAGKFTEAMEHLLVLASFGWDTKALEADFKEAILPLAEDQEESSSLLALVASHLDEHPSWDWLREYGLIVLSWGGGTSKAPEYLAALDYSDIEKHVYHFTSIWAKAKEYQDWDLAWQIAEVLDSLIDAALDVAWQNNYYDTVRIIEQILGPNYSYQEWLCQVHLIQDIFSQDPAKFVALQEKNSGNPLLAVGRASSIAGLDWLIQWESLHQVDEEFRSIYSLQKSQLISQAEMVEPSQLNHILPYQLLSAALADVYNKAKLSTILDYLRTYPFMAQELDIAHSALDLPPPLLTLEDLVVMWISTDGVVIRGSTQLTGDGKGLLNSAPSDFGFTHKYYDLETGREFAIPSGYYSLAPSSSLLAVEVSSLNSEIQIYDRGRLIGTYPRDNSVERVGWRDADTLWLVKKELQHLVGNVNYLYSMSIADGSIRREEAVPAWKGNHWNSFWFGPRGRFAWTEAQTLRVYDGNRVYSVEIEQDPFIQLLCWRPDGGALMVSTGGKTFSYTLGGSLIEEVTFSSVEAWLSKDEIAFTSPLGTGQRMLGIYNAETEAVTWTGVIDPISIAGNRVLCRSGDKLYIYDLEELK